MKKFFLTLAIIGLTLSVHSQSIINKNLYIANPAGLNPAYMGTQGKLFLGFQTSISGNNELALPTYTSINVHGSVFENLGLGANFLSEKQGPFSLTMADVGSSYMVSFDEKQSLRFGMSVGFLRQTLNPSAYTTNNYVDQNDPFLNGDFYDNTRVKMGAGFLYQNGNFELGVGTPYLFRGGESFNKSANFNAGYTWAFQGDKFKFNPSVFYQLKDQDSDLYDFNIRGIYMDKAWLQLGYRSNSSLNFSFGLATELFDIGYNYNSAMGDLKEINSNNHEILIAFTIKRKSTKRYTKSSRASESFSVVKRGEMEEKFIKLHQKYDSLAQIESSRRDDEKLKREKLHTEIEKIREELGIVSSNLEYEESRVVKEELTSDRLAIEPGNYVVVSTCNSLLCAEQVQADLKEAGENHTRIVLNKAKGFYYIATSRHSNFKEALGSMEQKRKTGYQDSWVLVYK
ncbi:MAG: PorP/SprF family type IX secretion system membrane protein [Cyclobacteriaceae bacterium]